MATTKYLYLVDGILVDAVLTKGGGFYETTVVSTGQKQTVVAKAFLKVARPIKVNDDELATSE